MFQKNQTKQKEKQVNEIKLLDRYVVKDVIFTNSFYKIYKLVDTNSSSNCLQVKFFTKPDTMNQEV